MVEQWVEASQFLGGEHMGRRKRTKMIIRDVKVEEGKCIIAVEIRRGANSWKKAYMFSSGQLKEGEFDGFNKALMAKVHADAMKLEEDQHFHDRVMLRIEAMVDQTVLLD